MPDAAAWGILEAASGPPGADDNGGGLYMEQKENLIARAMVEHLSRGLHPVTGEPLPPSDCCADQAVQQALRAVLAQCAPQPESGLPEGQPREGETLPRPEASGAGTERKAAGFARYFGLGNSWTPEEDAQLLELYFNQKQDIWQVAKTLKKKPQGVLSRLKKLGY